MASISTFQNIQSRRGIGEAVSDEGSNSTNEGRFGADRKPYICIGNRTSRRQGFFAGKATAAFAVATFIAKEGTAVIGDATVVTKEGTAVIGDATAVTNDATAVIAVATAVTKEAKAVIGDATAVSKEVAFMTRKGSLVTKDAFPTSKPQSSRPRTLLNHTGP